MTIKEQLIREIEQAPEASLIKFMQIWQFAKQSGFTAISSEDWEQHQETLFVLQNDVLINQISRSRVTHEQRQGYQPSKEEMDEILSFYMGGL